MQQVVVFISTGGFFDTAFHEVPRKGDEIRYAQDGMVFVKKVRKVVWDARTKRIEVHV